MAARLEVDIPEAFEDLWRPARLKVYWGGRGGAKSWSIARALLLMGVQRPLRILCAREIQRSIRQSVHQLLKDTINELGLHDYYRVMDTEIRGKKNDTLVMYDGLQAHTVDSIKSYEAIDIVWVEEGQTVKGRSWEILLPTIRKPGSEIWISMNPILKTDPAWRLFVDSKRADAVVRHVTWRDNPWFTGELEAERAHAQETMDPDTYENVWEGMPRGSVQGAIWGAQIKVLRRLGRIGHVPPKTELAVNAFMDLGTSVGNATAIWLHQHSGTQHRFIKHWAETGLGMDHWWTTMNDWVKAKGLRWGSIYMPHDAQATLQGAELTNRLEIMESLIARDSAFVDVVAVPRTTDVTAAIELTRTKFSDVWIDEAECEDGVLALESYKYKWDEERQAFTRQPYHDWASNSADAFRQWAQGYEAPDPRRQMPAGDPWSGTVRAPGRVAY